MLRHNRDFRIKNLAPAERHIVTDIKAIKIQKLMFLYPDSILRRLRTTIIA